MWTQLKQKQREDAFFGPMIQFLEGQKAQAIDASPHLKTALPKESEKYFISPSGLLLRFLVKNGRAVVCVPEVLAPHAARICHATPWAGHLGQNACLNFAHMHFWWPRMSSDIAEVVRKCPICAQYKPANRKHVARL
ncbi:integrase zinc binding domain-containing protein, partial [Xanthobacter tagetidis]|uniref:integrase zinc binding domain-containing protein n=1 Tax=Xanthobacter tagetidis TaxID=60216 RepID=UPI001474C5AD